MFGVKVQPTCSECPNKEELVSTGSERSKKWRLNNPDKAREMNKRSSQKRRLSGASRLEYIDHLPRYLVNAARKRANRLKSDATASELRAVLHYMEY